MKQNAEKYCIYGWFKRLEPFGEGLLLRGVGEDKQRAKNISQANFLVYAPVISVQATTLHYSILLKFLQLLNLETKMSLKYTLNEQ